MFGRKRQTVVKRYRSRPGMSKGVKKMTARGYLIAGQSGEFKRLNIFHGGRITVTWVLGEAALPHKRCPQCAEDVLAEAQVCKYCGHRFYRIDEAALPSPELPAASDTLPPAAAGLPAAASASSSGQEAVAEQADDREPVELICPHCQTRGRVRLTEIDVKQGVSARKAAGAIFTGGVSILATGLAGKGRATQAHCAACNTTWTL